MTTKQLRWLDTSKREYYRDVPLKGLTKYLIDQDVEFLRELWADWEE